MSYFSLTGKVKPAAKQAALRQAERALKDAWISAVREYVRAMLFESGMVVDSGMSAASVFPLARAVRILTLVRSGIIPNQREKPRLYKSYDFGPDGYKTIPDGESHGEDGYELTLPSLGNGLRAEFSFKITVLQFYLHERAWGALPTAEAAFRKELNEGLAQINRGVLNVRRV
jgi:hypothetical protein